MIGTAGRHSEKRHTISKVRHTISYYVNIRCQCLTRHRMSSYDIVYQTYDIVCQKCAFDIVYDMHLRCRIRCRMQTTFYIICISEPMKSHTICFPCDLRYRMYVIRYRRSKYDTMITYDVVPTMSQVFPLNIVHTIMQVRCDIRYRRCDLRCRSDRPTISQVTYNIVCGKNPDDAMHVITVTCII